MYKEINKHKNRIFWEFVFQTLLFGAVFLFYIYDPDPKVSIQVSVHMYDLWFFLNYGIAVSIINYVLLPKLLYRKRYFAFFLSLIFVIGAVMAIEEGIIEKIYFPDTRGAHFASIFFNLAGILPVITILSGFKFAWDAFHKQQELDDLKAMVIETELQHLRSQINPHFLFNNLNTIYSYALDQSPKAPEIILELSSVLRYMLYECGENYVPLSKEKEQLIHFIHLNAHQIEGRGTIQSTISSNAKDFMIAPLILIVFIENAFKHSISSLQNNISISIELNVSEDGLLTFVCKNNYSDQSNTADLGNGIGLQNVKKRLDLLYPNKHHLEIDKTDGLFTVKLKLDLNHPENV